MPILNCQGFFFLKKKQKLARLQCKLTKFNILLRNIYESNILENILLLTREPNPQVYD